MKSDLWRLTFICLSVVVLQNSEAAAYTPIQIPPNEAIREQFEKLSSSEIESFQENRNILLSLLEKALHKAKWTFGIGYVTSNIFRFIREKIQVREAPSREILEMMREQGYEEPMQAERKRRKYSEFSQRTVDAILEKVDLQLWKDLKLVSAANALGGIGAIGNQTAVKIQQKGFLLFSEVGLIFFYDKSAKTLVFQIFKNIESFKSSVSPLAITEAISFKLGVYLAVEDGNIKETVKTEFFYPMGVPGFGGKSDKSLMFGMSTAVPGLTVVPFGLDNLFTATTIGHMKVILQGQYSLEEKSLVFNYNLGVQSVFNKIKNKIDPYFKRGESGLSEPSARALFCRQILS